MYKELTLEAVDEPKDMLNELRGVKLHLHDKSDTDWDSEAIWFRNKIPSYLWKNWKNTLAEVGFTWPKFLKHMKYHTRDMKRLLDEQILWDDFTATLKKTLDEDTKRKLSTH